MFEGIELHEIRYRTGGEINSLEGIEINDPVLASAEGLSTGQSFIRDTSFRLDGVSRVCPFFPISPMARRSLLYVQSFSYWQAGAGYYTRRHGLDSMLLVYTYGGSGQLEYEGETFRCRSGDAFLIDCRRLHTYRTLEAPWEHAVLHFNGVCAASLYETAQGQIGTRFRPASGREFQRGLERLLKSYSSINPYREYQISTQLSALLLNSVMGSDSYRRMQQSMPSQIEEIARYLNMHYAQEVSLDQLSESFAISKYHLCRTFKKFTGFTLNEYVTQLRMERAKDLLRATTLPANRIAGLVGIHDENYFYRLFRKHTGQSPHRYRKVQ